MKPHPKIRKTVKWGGAVVTALLVVLWIGSGWWYYLRISRDWTCVSVSSGTVLFSKVTGLKLRPTSDDTFGRATHVSFEWWIRVSKPTERSLVVIPLWLPAGASLLVTTGAWGLDIRARRRARVGLCHKCRYNRAGLPSQAVCPECGAAATPPSPSV